MLHRGQEGARETNVGRWKPGRGGLLRGCGAPVAGRSFEEDLALFERQVREERAGRAGRPAGVVSCATTSH